MYLNNQYFGSFYFGTDYFGTDEGIHDFVPKFYDVNISGKHKTTVKVGGDLSINKYLDGVLKR